MRESFMPLMPGVIMHFNTIAVEYGLRSPAVFETVKMYVDACVGKQAYFMEEVEDAPIIHRPRHIQAHDM
jgi:hypothetical protein